MKESIRDTTNGLDYTLVNDYYLPNLTAATPAKQHPIGRWGRLHKNYLKEQHPIRYNQLVLSGELGSYLAKLDEQAEEQLAFDRPADAGSRGCDRSPESCQSDGMGAADEQHPQSRRRNYLAAAIQMKGDALCGLSV